jgi:hypothetical protein
MTPATTLEIITPSFAGDFELCRDLHRSVLALTGANVRHQILVPARDVDLFSQLAGARTVIRPESQVLPHSFVRSPWGNWTINIRRPFPPVRGWILQQLVKLAAVAQSQADVVVVVDSDIEFVRAFSADTFRDGDAVRFYCLPDGVTATMPRHVLWHQAARRLLGLPEAPPPPLPDYISSLIAWDPAIVRRLLERVEAVTRRRWFDAIAAQLHFSEWTLYGVYVDEIHGRRRPGSDRSLCHAYWGTVPLDDDSAAKFFAQLAPDDVAIMVSAKTHTPLAVRRAAFRALTP